MTVAVTDLPFRIAHLASLHCGDITFEEDLLARAVEEVNASQPDLVVVAGDLTAAGYRWEYEQAAGWLDRISAPTVVVMGNHDARNVGEVHYEHLFGQRFTRHRFPFSGDRAERLRATGVTVVAVDSSQPDLDEGHIGREWYRWVTEQFDEPEDFKLFVIHHHLVSIPGSGRALNVITDAGDLLPRLTRLRIDMILSGHRHVPYFWGLNGVLVCNAGTVSTRRVPGTVQPSWNELTVDASTIKVHVHYADGRRELAAIRMRTSLPRVREAFHVTDGFFDSNHLLTR